MFKFNKLSTLKVLFDRYITISAIAEDFIAFDASRDVSECLAYMKKYNFDVIGVRENGCVVGYARLSQENKGLLGDHKIGFENDEILFNNDPLPEALHHLAKKPLLFIKASDEIVGIITRADLHKPAFRIWLFGLISVLEIHMFELIHRTYPENGWKDNLSEKRKGRLKDVYETRKRSNEEIDWLSCCEFCDKRTIIGKNPIALEATGFKSTKDFSENLKDIELLRNEVAHSCKVSKARWEAVSKLCKIIESLIANIEKFLSRENRDNRL